MADVTRPCDSHQARDGRTTFGLPDLRGRAALHLGNGPGLSPRPIGAKRGNETEALTIAQMPSLQHTLSAHSAAADQQKPQDNALASAMTGHAPPADVPMAGDSIGFTGGGQAHNNMQPFLVINFCIALVGVYPSRS